MTVVAKLAVAGPAKAGPPKKRTMAQVVAENVELERSDEVMRNFSADLRRKRRYDRQMRALYEAVIIDHYGYKFDDDGLTPVGRKAGTLLKAAAQDISAVDKSLCGQESVQLNQSTSTRRRTSFRSSCGSRRDHEKRKGRAGFEPPPRKNPESRSHHGFIAWTKPGCESTGW